MIWLSLLTTNAVFVPPIVTTVVPVKPEPLMTMVPPLYCVVGVKLLIVGATPRNPLSFPAPKVPPALMSDTNVALEVYFAEPATVPAAAVAACVVQGPAPEYKPILGFVPAAKFAFSSVAVFHCVTTVRLLPEAVPSFTFQYRLTNLVLSFAAGEVVASTT